MELYLVLVDNRHDDVTAHAFTRPEVAVDFARQHYEDNVPDDLSAEELKDAGVGVEPVDGFLFHAVYSTEGDSVWVAPVELDAAVTEAPAATADDPVGARVVDGGSVGTVVRCGQCGGSGRLHQPDELPDRVAPTLADNTEATRVGMGRDESTARALAAAVNRMSEESGSNTPDFVLGDFLTDALAAFHEATRRREQWYGVRLEPGRGLLPAAEGRVSAERATTLVFEALGEASMCWEHPAGAGIFLSQQAEEIGHRLLAALGFDVQRPAESPVERMLRKRSPVEREGYLAEQLAGGADPEVVAAARQTMTEMDREPGHAAG
jgi:hypothetical protein